MANKAFRVLMAGLLLASACAPVEENLIQGRWQGVAVLEEGEPLNIDPTVISMTFGENNSYAYSSTLNYRESGSFYIDSKYLYTTDTLNQASTEKAVEIVSLTADSLTLKMNEGGRERLLKMARHRD